MFFFISYAATVLATIMSVEAMILIEGQLLEDLLIEYTTLLNLYNMKYVG